MKKSKQSVVIIGAGPAGLGCGYELVESKSEPIKLTIIDKNDVVGGLARTYLYKNHFFDIGPHRFFTKNEEVFNLWKKILKKDLLTVNRLTRIHYNNKIFYYPIQLKDVLLKLGLITDTQIFFSFLYSKIFLKNMIPITFEQSITKDFGWKLYSIFFKTYSEKVWGISCDQISAKWAAQRIKNLNLLEVLKTAILGQNARKAKSLVEKFYYPKNGAGQLYEKIAQVITQNKGKIELNSSVQNINHKNKKITSISYKKGKKIITQDTDYLFSSMPLTDFILNLSPKPSQDIITAAKKLIYREHLTVNLIIKGNNLFPDNWIYIHSPHVQMARVANYNNFNNVNKNRDSAIAVEYFTFQTDKLWKMSDDQLIKLAIEELLKTDLITSADLIKEGFVIRETESYPAYYMGYEKYYDKLKKYVEQFKNLQLIGRGGMYKYNNMDHAIYSGLLSARNYNLGYKKYDVWEINEDAEYLEESKNKS